MSDVEEEGQSAVPVEPPHIPVTTERALGALAMALICLISFANVLVRYVTDFSFAFTEEYSTFLMVFMTFVGAALASAGNSHIRITVIVNRLPPAGRIFCEMLSVVATTLMFSLVVYYGGLLTWFEFKWGETSPGLGYPRWIYTIWAPMISIVVILRAWGFVLRLLRAERKARAGGAAQ
ncbi:TRAP transporter small permease [Fodinicurvata fenggangensis]|uniref:TRAP transporter small permease n=1 Tax=Fodinicurvata fenggangensis TaxID=1121830 RepID=UPI00047B2241|nr:TRAP transporter small permease [Fodinicurvata fenggangensis]